MTKTSFRQPLHFSKPALVFSGGATKAAAFHVGVCLALRDKGFSFVGGKAENPPPNDACAYPRPRYHPHQIATYVGSSAGALIVSMLGAGLGVESVINSFSRDTDYKVPGDHKEIPPIQYRDILKFNWPNLKAVIKSLKKSPPVGQTLETLFMRNIRTPGLFSTRGLAEYLRNHVLPTDQFHELKADVFVVGTQLDHSRKIIFGRYGTEKATDDYCQYASNVCISDAVAASMSLPPIFAPYLVAHKGGKQRYYIDGEIRETLSTHVAKENGCDLLICSYTHQPYHYNKETGSLYNYGIPAIGIQAIYQMIEQKLYGVKRAHHNKKVTIETIQQFFKEKHYPEADLEELVEELKKKIDFNEKLNLIFIHPESRDQEMFFGDHFALNAQTLQNVVSIGYRRAMAELRKFDLIPESLTETDSWPGLKESVK